MSSLTELREKVERASGADRELDLLIGLTIDGWQLGELVGGFPRGTFSPVLGGTLVKDSSGDVNVAVPGGMYPAPTESIDAALALVERKLPNAWVNLDGCGRAWTCILTPTDDKPQTTSGDIPLVAAPTAILACLLRALESQEQAGG